jgi:hypothetical protein
MLPGSVGGVMSADEEALTQGKAYGLIEDSELDGLCALGEEDAFNFLRGGALSVYQLPSIHSIVCGKGCSRQGSLSTGAEERY